FDGASLRIYVNGTLVRSKAQAGSIVEASAPLKIGGDWSGEMFTGIIDEVRVYAAALSQTQIQADMNTPVGTAPTVTITSPADPPTLSGTPPLAAPAAGQGVAGAQFQIDGTNFGPLLTSAPYTEPWDTTTAADGPHTITAVVTDTRGNTASS